MQKNTPDKTAPKTPITEDPISETEIRKDKISGEALQKAKEAASMPTEPQNKYPGWPPPPRLRKRRSWLASSARYVAIVLVALLVISGISLLVFGTSRHFQFAVTQYSQTQIQATQSAVARQQATATAHAQETAQANNLATAAAQVNTNSSTPDTQATAAAATNLLAESTSGIPTVDDPLNANTASSQWDSGTNSTKSGCQFQNGTYHSSEAQQGYLQPCLAEGFQFDNFVYQISLTIQSGEGAQAGIIFRSNDNAQSYYYFHISTDNTYGLDLITSTSDEHLVSSSSSAIKPGLGQINQITVMADQNMLYLFANDQYLISISEIALSSGKIGVAVIDINAPVNATFSDAQVWQMTAQTGTDITPPESPTAGPGNGADLSTTPTPTITPNFIGQ
ncbi:MAG TPA: hypothetical protein VL461_14735 [Dictyobacter sp.]|jgi:hypothetical protein|nr:hypothetical protein [Dictyobacter sp.]